jgi:hypothetical protein
MTKMSKKTIQKKFQTSPINAVTEPSLDSDSTVNVPTVHAVKGEFDEIKKSALFILSEGNGFVEFGTYDEWVAAGKPVLTNITSENSLVSTETE